MDLKDILVPPATLPAAVFLLLFLHQTQELDLAAAIAAAALLAGEQHQV